jgi:hypothetical protein
MLNLMLNNFKIQILYEKVIDLCNKNFLYNVILLTLFHPISNLFGNTRNMIFSKLTYFFT